MHRSKTHPLVHGLQRSLALTAILVGGAGCSSSTDTQQQREHDVERTRQSSPIRVIVVDDEPLATTIERQWKAASEGSIQVEHITAKSVGELQETESAADVLIYPSSWLGELVEGNLLIPVSSRVLGDPQYDREDLLSLDQTAVTWGEKTYAFSFGVPQLVLMYRKDVFERLELAPPRTWGEYQQLADRLAQEEFATPCVEPLAPGWGAHMLLARAASYARQRSRYWTLFDFENMEPMIDSPPFQKALEQLVSATIRIPESERMVLTPERARENVFTGRSVIALTWPTAGDERDGSPVNQAVIGFAQLPGSRGGYDLSGESWIENGGNNVSRVSLFGFDGRLGSVLSTSANPHEAFNFLAWLTGKERSVAICSSSSHTAPFRQSHASKARRWVSAALPADSVDAYFDAVAASKRETLVLGGIRIPGRDAYLQALDQAVSDALSGKDSASALAAAADRWRETTKQLGIDQQQAAYQRSLGLEP